MEPIILEYEKFIDNGKKSNKTTDKKEKLNYSNLSIFHCTETNRLITSIASMITYEKSQVKDPFWNNSAKNLLEGLIVFS